MSSNKQLEKEVKHYGGFRSHATLFILVMGGCWGLWWLTGSSLYYGWLLLPSFIWGFLLAIHWYIVYREINNDQRS